MQEIEITEEMIRTLFPEFRDGVAYTPAMISVSIEMAKAYVSPYNIGKMRESTRRLMLELMTAHILSLRKSAISEEGSGGASGQVKRTKIGDVYVETVAPSNKSQLTYWMNQTPYGQQYLALISSLAIPIYVSNQYQRVFNIW